LNVKEGGQRTEDGRQKAGGGRQKAESRRQKAEGGRREGRRQEAEVPEFPWREIASQKSTGTMSSALGFATLRSGLLPQEQGDDVATTRARRVVCFLQEEETNNQALGGDFQVEVLHYKVTL